MISKVVRSVSRAPVAFVQHYEIEVLDAALLIMPAVGFVVPEDSMWQSTLRTVDEELGVGQPRLPLRPGRVPGRSAGRRGHTFTMSTFWYVEALARSGQLDEARLVFEKMLTHSNHLGLHSEEIAPSGEQVGNVPQAFSHLSWISTAIVLDEMLSD